MTGLIAEKPLRDHRNGQFGFKNNWDRMCVCGHPLAVHGEAGVSCLNEDRHADPRATGIPCDCEKFKPVKGNK